MNLMARLMRARILLRSLPSYDEAFEAGQDAAERGGRNPYPKPTLAWMGFRDGRRTEEKVLAEEERRQDGWRSWDSPCLNDPWWTAP